MHATDRVNDLLRQTLVPLARAAGFRKTKFNFHRRRGTAVQMINIQLSQGNTSDEARFYINLGLCFDELCTHRKQPVNETPKEYECQWRQRMEEVLAGSPPHWTLTADADVPQMADVLRPHFQKVIENLDQFASLEQFCRHNWFALPADPEFKCSAHYVAGDLDASWKEVQHLAVLFSDRKNVASEEWWVEHCNLDQLKPRLEV